MNVRFKNKLHSKDKLKKELKKVLQSIGLYDTTDMFFIVDEETGEMKANLKIAQGNHPEPTYEEVFNARRKFAQQLMQSVYGREGVLKTIGVHGNTYKTYIVNLLEILSESTISDVQEGMEWYKKANEACQDISENTSKGKVFVTDDTVAQVISALSPATKWERNLIDAAKLVQAYKDGANPDNVACCTYGKNKQKAWDILQGATILSPSATSGQKTYAFYRNIINPMCKEHVTIDRHAIKAMRGNLEGGGLPITAKQYRIAEQVYKDLAETLGYIPCELQAIVWVTYKRIVGR